MRIGIIQFPGSNCERETMLAVKRAGMEPIECLWNTPKEIVSQFDGFIIVGGFSYEDRSRAGIIAALDPIMDTIQEQNHLGKPILGICNGAQVLVEKGLVPGLSNNKLGAALTDNIRIQNNKILGSGYYNAWVNIRLSDECLIPRSSRGMTADHENRRMTRNAFTRYLTPQSILSIPVAHGEGRFVIPRELLKEMQSNGQNVFQYCDASGNISNEFPVNPNGSIDNLAAISNKAGNVLAIMPHPERTIHGDVLLHSMRDYIAEGYTKQILPMHYEPAEFSITPYFLGSKLEPAVKSRDDSYHTSNTFEMIIDTMIVDNHAMSVENALRRKGMAVNVQRYVHWELVCNSPAVVNEIKTTGVLFNDRKEFVLSPEQDHQLKKLEGNNQDFCLLVRQKDDIHGKHALQMLRRHFNVSGLVGLSKSILWKISPVNNVSDFNSVSDSNSRLSSNSSSRLGSDSRFDSHFFMQQLIHSHILFNPYAYDCYKY